MTTVESSTTPMLVAGMAALVATLDPSFVWSLDGTYEAGDTGIGVMTFPQDCDRAIAIAPYPLSQHPTLGVAETGIQIKCRSASEDPFEVMQMDDTVRNGLHGRFPTVLPNGVHVAALFWTSGTSLGRDEATPRRWVWSSNYTARHARP